MQMNFLKVMHCYSIDEYNELAQYKILCENKILVVVSVVSKSFGFDVYYLENDEIITPTNTTISINPIYKTY